MLVRRGDTIIEVIISITVFCLVAILSITLMNSGVSSAQASLELTMTRNEIDAQAEALRFIQNAFIAERELSADQQQYTQLWRRITTGQEGCTLSDCAGLAIEASELPEFTLATCDEAYDTSGNPRNIFDSNAFVLNSRYVSPSGYNIDATGADYTDVMNQIVISASSTSATGTADRFRATPLYPRLVFGPDNAVFNPDYEESSDDLIEDTDATGTALYRTVARAEGIWVIAVKGVSSTDTIGSVNNTPEFFDFYIRSCWYAPGDNFPSTIGTIVRLYNPEVIPQDVCPNIDGLQTSLPVGYERNSNSECVVDHCINYPGLQETGPEHDKYGDDAELGGGYCGIPLVIKHQTTCNTSLGNCPSDAPPRSDFSHVGELVRTSGNYTIAFSVTKGTIRVDGDIPPGKAIQFDFWFSDLSGDTKIRYTVKVARAGTEYRFLAGTTTGLYPQIFIANNAKEVPYDQAL